MWGNPTLFHRGKSFKKIEKIEKSFVIGLLAANNAVYRVSLILRKQETLTVTAALLQFLYKKSF